MPCTGRHDPASTAVPPNFRLTTLARRTVLSLPDHWIWDSWIADDGERYHLFFLKAPRALEDPALRHTRGHASATRPRPTSCDWDRPRGRARPRRDAGGWDDLALWTGSAVRGDDGSVADVLHGAQHRRRARRARPAHRRRGVRRPAHLARVRRRGRCVERRPALVPHARRDGTASETWRDPFVFRDPDGDGWHMLITARDPDAPRLSRRRARPRAQRTDLASWELRPPLSGGRPASGRSRCRRCAWSTGGRVLVFTCHPEEQSDARRADATACYSTWSVPATGGRCSARGTSTPRRPFEAEPKLFAAPLVQARDGGWVLFGFRNRSRRACSRSRSSTRSPSGSTATGTWRPARCYSGTLLTSSAAGCGRVGAAPGTLDVSLMSHSGT